MRKSLWLVPATLALVTAPLVAQGGRPLSPRGQAATQILGEYSTGQQPSYEGGKWIEVDYGRPILRQRKNFFGEGENYGKQANAGAPVWRAGANQSTRLKTEVDLKFGDKTVPAGEYSLFIELKSPTEWTLIVSNWGAQQQYSRDDKENLWGAYGYTADKDVARIPMQVQQIQNSIDQLTIGFADVTKNSGTLFLVWDTNFALAPFTAGM